MSKRPARLLEHRAAPVVGLALIYALAVVVYSVLAGKHSLPDLFPDEVFYGKLSQSFAAGNGLSWRGSSWGLPPLWPIVLSVVWHSGSTTDGYALGKVLGALLACSTVVPVWLLAKEFAGPRVALVPALLSVAGAWMVNTSYLASENLAYPLATASLACTVMAVRRPGSRWLWASLAFAVPAALTRTQMLVLPAILVVALVIDVVRQPPGERRARVDARPKALWIALLALVIGLPLAFVVEPELTNYAVFSHHAGVGKIAEATGKQAAASVIVFAFIPVAAFFAMAARAANWRDDVSGPLLATIAAGVIVLIPVLGRFEAFATSGPVDRYVMYLGPLLLVAMVVAQGRIGRSAAVAAAVAVALIVLLVPLSKNYIEQPAVYGAERRVQELGGFFADHIRLGLLLFALPLTVAGTYALGIWRRRGAGLAVAAGLVFAVMAAQAWTSQDTEIDLINRFRTKVAPEQLDWVDRRVDVPVAGLDIGKPQNLTGNIDLYTDFFNRKVDKLYSTAPAGGHECRVTLSAGGTLVPKEECGSWPRHFVIQPAPYKATLQGQEVLASTPNNGTLVRIPGAAPRVLALVKPPCGTQGCSGELAMGLYLQRRSEIAVTFGPSGADHAVLLGKKTAILKAGQPTTLRFPVPGGDRAVRLPVNWDSPLEAPRLESVTVTSGGQSVRIW